MGLKQRKRIKNMSNYANGKDGQINWSDRLASNQDWSYKLANQKNPLEPQLNPLVSKVPSQPQLNVKSPQSSAGISGLQGATSIAQQFNPLDKIVELYERLLQSEREKIELLKKR